VILDWQPASTTRAEDPLIERGKPLYDPVQACLSRVLGDKHPLVGQASGKPPGAWVIHVHGQNSIVGHLFGAIIRPLLRAPKNSSSTAPLASSSCQGAQPVEVPHRRARNPPKANPADNQHARCSGLVKSAECLADDSPCRCWRLLLTWLLGSRRFHTTK
jgi:hypothetical protein